MSKLIKVECGKCIGKGYIRAFSGIKGGICFACEGKGHKMLKNKPVAPRKFTVSFLWTDKKDCNYNGGDFCHCWNINSRSKPAVERKAEAAMKNNGSVDYRVEEVVA